MQLDPFECPTVKVVLERLKDENSSENLPGCCAEEIGISLSTLQDEIEDTVDYESNKVHVSSNARKWPSVLLVCELAFSLPLSNVRVEQIFHL